MFAIGALAGTLLWLGFVWIPRRLAPVEALRAFAAARGAFVRGDGRVQPINVVGHVRGRPFTVTWQRPAGGGDVLLVGVDCNAAVREPLEPVAPASDTGADVTSAADAALVTRWVRPTAAVLTAERLGAIVDAMAILAEELEASHPAEDHE